MRKVPLCLSAVILSLALGSAYAATWTVTTTNSGGACTAASTTDSNCTLDAAIVAAGNGDTILFAAAVQTQTIFFNPMGNLTASVTIDGSPNGVVLDGSGNHFMFYVTSNPTVVLSHLTFQHGLGGNSGGAIYVDTGAVTIDSCTFAHNVATVFGGAIFFSYGTLTILNSTFFDNHVSPGPGPGGAIAAYGGTLVIANSTITGNASNGTAGASTSSGGGLFSCGANVFLMSSIVAANSSSGLGHDIYEYVACGGGASSLGNNLFGEIDPNDGVPADPNTDQVGNAANPIDAQFSSAGLTSNGGATPTIALLSSSPAVRNGNCAGHTGDAASPTIPAAILDQRGIVRGAPCAIGAYDATVIFYGGFED